MKVMRVVNIFVVLVMAASLVGGLYANAGAQTPVNQGAPIGPYVPGEVVVGYTKGEAPTKSAAQAHALAGQIQAQVVKQEGNTFLFSFQPGANVEELSARIGATAGVAFAEPNYIYKIPDLVPADPDYKPPATIEKTAAISNPKGEVKTQSVQLNIADLKALRTIKNGRITATYPNDPYLWTNWGWSAAGADIVWPNTTPSANICLLDTGTDYTHPDLIRSGVKSVIKGWDFINDDADPMDDNGHGTHTAGIIAATAGNAQGMAGVSNGKVVAVKVLNAQGWGTNFGVAAGINYCANRTDVKVLSMSLGGNYSTAVENAVNYAVNIRGKLVVASAGNGNTSEKSYPAGLADDPAYLYKVLAVAATDNGDTTSPGCRASYSNYGSWVSVAAPGTNIYSTLPYNKSFYLGYYLGYPQNYAFMSGTSMAAPFVAAATARRWGYKPASANAQVGWDVINSGRNITGDDSCWPVSMNNKRQLNVAALLDRGAVFGYIKNATTGNPLNNAQLLVYQGLALRGNGLTALSSTTSSYAEVINLPVGDDYEVRVNKAGYTNGNQPAFWHTGPTWIRGGWWLVLGEAAIPEKSSNFTVTVGWDSSYGADDLDMYTWLPPTPNPLDPGQPAPFVVGINGSDFGYLEGDSTGTLMAFPFAIYNREGGYYDYLPLESITISNRKAHYPLAANAALPYYPGSYFVGITDLGKMITSGTDTYHAMFVAFPYSYVWKDGRIINGGYNYDCNDVWWYPWRISSVTSTTSLKVDWFNACLNDNPYTGAMTPGSGTGVKMR